VGLVAEAKRRRQSDEVFFGEDTMHTMDLLLYYNLVRVVPVIDYLPFILDPPYIGFGQVRKELENEIVITIVLTLSMEGAILCSVRKPRGFCHA